MGVVDQHVRFTKKNTPAFGEREFWQCDICNASGGDEPALGHTAREMAEKHFDKVRAHYRAVAFEPPPNAKHDELYKWMKDELAIYGQMSPSDAASITSQMAHDFFRYEISERDELIERLTNERNELREALAQSK